MLSYAIQRFGQLLLTLFVMATTVFLAVYAIGDPVQILANPEATEEEMEAIRVRLGLDGSLFEQYTRFIWNVLRGDFGNSFAFGEPAFDLIVSRLPATIELAVAAFFLSTVIGVSIGLYAGLYPHSPVSKTVMACSILGFSLPNFWQGMMLIMIFAVALGLLPAGGRGDTATVLGITSSLFTIDGLRHLILPAMNLALYQISLNIRLTRAITREVTGQEYIRFATAKGLPGWRIVWLHVLKNTLVPLVTILGLEFGSLLAFGIVTETIFAYPGAGKLLIDAISRLDRPVIVAYLMLTVCIFAIVNFVVDLLYAALDPRVRLSKVSQ